MPYGPRTLFPLVITLAVASPTAAATHASTETSRIEGRLQRAWSAAIESRVASSFQLSLGGFYGPAPSQQTRLTLSVSNVFRDSDRVSLTAFEAFSVPSRRSNWWASLSYQWRVASKGKWRWNASAGLERWRFPSVLRGTQDWAAAWCLSARRPARHVTWLANLDGRTTLVSNVPRGSVVLLGVQAQHPLKRWERSTVSLQHGPFYAHSWRLYGTQGPRVLRYSAAVSWDTRRWTADAGIRPQAGLGPRVPDYLFWSFGVAYRFDKR